MHINPYWIVSKLCSVFLFTSKEQQTKQSNVLDNILVGYNCKQVYHQQIG